MKNKIGKIVIAWLLVVCMIAPMLPDLGLVLAADVANEYNYDAMSMDEIFELDKSLTWVFAGDSITQNDRWTQGMNGYAEWFEQYLYDIGRKDSVVVSAWSGASIREFQPSSDGAISSDGKGLENMVTKYNPDVVCIKMGMNDRNITTEEFTNAYEAMLDGIYAASKAQTVPKIPKVVLLTPSPVSSENKYDDMHHTNPIAGANEVQDTTLHLQKAIKAIWEEYDKTYNPIFCDLRTAFLDEALVLGDDYHRTFFGDPSDGKLHPNAAGQYFIFKTLCEALEIDTTSNDIFKFSYDDINSGTVYVDGTSGVTYANNYADTNGIDDATEMAKDLSGKRLLASVDFTDENGALNSSNKVNLTDKNVMDDALDVEEAKSMDKEYSVVFRAKFPTSGFQKSCQAIFSMNSKNTVAWNKEGTSSVNLLLPANGKMYYQVLQSKASLATAGNTPSNFSNVTGIGGGSWHTYALVQTEENLLLYVDGVATTVKSGGTNYALTKGIGTIFADATTDTFEAWIGSLGAKDDIYRVSGNFDYWQLYDGALTETEVEELSNESDSIQMDNAMQTLDDVTLTRLADVDFTSTNGLLTTANKVDLTDENVMDNELDVEEAKSMDKEYSVVFRAKFPTSGFQKSCQAIFSMNSKNTVAWNKAGTSSVDLLLPASGKMYYQVLQSKTSLATAGNTPSNFSSVKDIGGGAWHTYALVQTEENLLLYVDGVATTIKSSGTDYALTKGIGTIFADATTDTFEAWIGSLGAKDDIYRVSGNFDYWQLYNGALTAANVTTLTEAAEMNCTMPTLSTALTQNVLASVQFTEENSVLGGTDNPNVDLVHGEEVQDKLTLEEVKTIDREYTVAFRAKLDDAICGSQNIIYLGADNTTKWNDANGYLVNLPGTDKGGYYNINPSGSSSINGFINTINDKTCTSITGWGVDDNWHTFILVQNKDSLTIYVDGVPNVLKRGSNNLYIKETTSMVDIFSEVSDASKFEAYIGKLGNTASDKDNYKICGKFDYWTLYDGAFTEAQVESITEVVEADTKTTTWSSTLTKNNVWAVAGAEQMSGYEDTVAERSLFRLLDNTMRYDPHRNTFHTDIRMINASAPGYTVSDIEGKQSTVISNYSPNVYLLLPEVSEVYSANYSADSHEAKVTAYTNSIKNIVDANQAANITTILWTPLASSDATINNYLADYAKAVRNIVKDNSDVLFFDAYRFMDENMTNKVLKRNWFGNGLYISPLCALDLTYAFYAAMDETSVLTNELTDHNLRFSTDKRVFGDDYAYDNISVSAEVVDGTQNVAIDVANIDAIYSGATIQIAWVKDDGTEEIHGATQNGNTYTVAAPCDNPVFAVYATLDGAKYRFNNVEVAITGVTSETTPTEAKLNSLEVVGAPAIEFDADTISYNVQLYQYQKYVQVLATAQDGLTISVNGEPVASGTQSGLIDVTEAPSADSDAEPLKVTVDVAISGSETKTTYTLNLTRELNPDIIITEVMQDGYSKYTTGSGNDNYELIEIYNASGRDLNLLEYSIGYKQDNPESGQDVNEGEWPYYFTGNNQAFSGAQSTYTGINQITNYSTYDEAGNQTMVDSVDFPANSTMVIWVKYAPKNVSGEDAETYMDSMTYQTLIGALKAHETSGETLVVPTETQLVIAEIPKGTATAAVGDSYRVNSLAENASDTFYMDNHSTYKRSWLFILGKSATQAANGSITNDGDDIISAAKFARIGNTDKLSSVLSYNTERGMSLVKNEAYWDADTIGTPHTSDQQGYSNATTFGAIEYWQKPVNSKDIEQPVVLSTIDFENKSDATVNFTISDDTDIRYVEFYARKTGEETWTEVIKKDIVFEECVANTGVTADKTSYTFSYGLELAEDSTDSVEYYGLLVDGSGNVIEIGSEAEPVDSCKFELVKYTAEEVKEFINGGDTSYPEDVESYLFAGWYKNEDHENISKAIVTSADVPDNGAYALYIPEHVLSVQAQLSTNLLDNDLSDDATGAIRFVTSVDSLNYNDAGFYFTFDGNETEYKRSNNKVHDKLYGIRQDEIDKEDWLEKYSPSTSFCARSSYFKTHAWVNIAQSRFDLKITATPFVETLDGKIVKGEPVTKCINDGRGSEWIYVSAETGSDENGDGSREKPYATLENAFEHVEDKGVIYVVGEYQLPSDFTWPTSGKFVTITGDTLNCKAIAKGKSLNIKSAVRFDGITLQFTDGMWIWANGNELTIAENVTVEGTPEYLFGGSNNKTVDSTNVTVLAGNYQKIFGGGYNSNGVVTTNTYLHVGGKVNDNLSDNTERHVYGGGYNSAVNGTAKVEVDGQAYATYIFGAGLNANSSVNATDVTVSENATLGSVYGGGYKGAVNVGGETSITFKGGTVNIIVGSNYGVAMTGNTKVLITGGTINEVYGGSDSANVTGNTEVAVLGGKIVKQVYGGCKNSGTPIGSTRSVTGHTSVKIGPGADLAISAGDKAVYAVSRSSTNAADEKGVFIINGYRNNANKFIAGSNANATVSAIKSHHYFVNVSSGGDVSVQGDGVLAIKPDDGFKAIVKDVDGKVLETYNADATHHLPTYEDEEIVLYVEFTKITSETIYLSENGSDETGDGTQENPYQTLNCAIDKADNGDTISVIDTYTVDSDELWKAHGKDVTITGGTLDFSGAGVVSIQDAVTFDNIALTFTTDSVQTVYANGYRVEIGENVTFTGENTYIDIYAGGNGTTVMTTDLTLLAGDYKNIYGAGSGGTVLGDTNLHIAGTVNKTRDFAESNACVVYGAGKSNAIVNGDTHVYVGGQANSAVDFATSHKESAVIYGAGSNGTVKGDTNVTITDRAKVIRLHGGGYSGTVQGNARVTVSGTVNNDLTFSGNDYPSVYGGGYIDTVQKNTYVTIKENANFNRIYGGGRGYRNPKTQVITNSVIGECATVTVEGNVNSGATAMSHNHNVLLFGGSCIGTVGSTNVEIKGSAKFNYVYGAGEDSESEVLGTTSMKLDDTVQIMSVYGGGRYGTNGSTLIEMNNGTVEQVFGGCENASMTGNTNVRILGGTVVRRIYGGCYNDYGASGWASPACSVDGCTSVTIGPDVLIKLSYDDGKPLTPEDNTVYAVSRIGENPTNEKGIFILTNYENNSNKSKLEETDFELGLYNTDSHHYLVNVSAGGNVYVVDGTLKVVPNDGHTLASITYSDGTIPTTDGNGNYILPTKTDSVKTITVTFE